MAAYSFDFNDNLSSGNCFSGFVDPFWRDLGPFNGISHGGSSLSVPLPQSLSLVLDSEKSELVKTAVKFGKKSASEEKVMAAMKSHSEAERRRRERINVHLDTLRSLFPGRDKMDKATLLGEVIKQVKQLKKNATEASKGFLVPMDDDAVRVEACEDETNGTYCFKASICCDYRPELLTDLRQALDTLQIKILKAEISTLGSRLRNDFVFTGSRIGNSEDADEARTRLARSIQQALNSVMEKASISPEYLPCSTFPKKRRRISYFDSSSLSL